MPNGYEQKKSQKSIDEEKAYQERIKNLELAVDEWRDKADSELSINAGLHTENAHLQERIKELKELLTEYGRHQPGCPRQYGDKYNCRCGWDREREKYLKGSK